MAARRRTTKRRTTKRASSRTTVRKRTKVKQVFHREFVNTFGAPPQRHLGDLATMIIAGSASSALLGGMSYGAKAAFNKARRR
jgi:hypothetical protein